MVGAWALSGCGGEQPCRGGCPDISGAYQVEASAVAGECSFTPWLVGPTLVLTQTADGATISTEVIDPVNQIPVTLTGDVFTPTATETTFRMRGQTHRQDTQRSDLTSRFELRFNGTVLHGRALNGTFNMVQLGQGEEPGCQLFLTLTGDRADPNGSPAS